jgi:hypothetical protein
MSVHFNSSFIYNGYIRSMPYASTHTIGKLRREATLAAGRFTLINNCSEFHCFCSRAFYVSNFKDFNTQAPACC